LASEDESDWEEEEEIEDDGIGPVVRDQAQRKSTGLESQPQEEEDEDEGQMLADAEELEEAHAEFMSVDMMVGEGKSELEDDRLSTGEDEGHTTGEDEDHTEPEEDGSSYGDSVSGNMSTGEYFLPFPCWVDSSSQRPASTTK
jgi:hypothetical protein